MALLYSLHRVRKLFPSLAWMSSVHSASSVIGAPWYLKVSTRCSFSLLIRLIAFVVNVAISFVLSVLTLSVSIIFLLHTHCVKAINQFLLFLCRCSYQHHWIQSNSPLTYGLWLKTYGRSLQTVQIRQKRQILNC